MLQSYGAAIHRYLALAGQPCVRGGASFYNWGS
jgi:hypothetical protein